MVGRVDGCRGEQMPVLVRGPGHIWLGMRRKEAGDV